MSRLVNTNSPGKIRSQQRRTIAELLRHLMFKRGLDEDTKDMAAAIIFALRAIDETIETTVAAWEKRDYFVKADRFRLEWEWAAPAAKRLEQVIRSEGWERMPTELAGLLPRFADIKIAKMTRPPESWKASYRLLLEQAEE
jgi:hypothetical protein